MTLALRETPGRPRYVLLSVASLVVIGMAAVLDRREPALFRPYFGANDATLVVASLCVVGALCLELLRTRRGFEIAAEAKRGEGLVVAALVASVLALGMILVDLAVVLPEDLNVRLPQALLFYPVMAYVVEMLFHALPLALLLVLRPVARRVGRARVLWPWLVVVALLEPTFQVQAGFSEGIPRWAMAYVGLNVFAINGAQLLVFERYDFVSMIALRLIYYLHWHLLWGQARLQLLF